MPSRRELANAIRALSMDAVQQAKSGHPGMPMGMADIAEVLWNNFLVHNPKNPRWANRDRFILSNGHGSMLLYSLLHLTGYDMTTEDLTNFRQLHAKTAGHPEYGLAPGIETTTGPLGQGLANAIGMAIAEKNLAATYNQDGCKIIDHYTYVFLGDGCLMEGISHEASSLAGTLGLGKLIAFWDDNHISIDGNTSGWFTDNTTARFKAYGWHVIPDVDGHDANEVEAAIIAARQIRDKPSLICCRTKIGYGAPNVEGSHHCHGAPLGEEEIAAAKQALEWRHPAFSIPSTISSAWDATERGMKAERDWEKKFAFYQQTYPELANELLRRLEGKLPKGCQDKMSQFIQHCNQAGNNIATRKASYNFLNSIAPALPELIGGSADLSGSNLTNWKGSVALKKENIQGNYIHYGVREFGMSAIMNGLALHGGFIPYGGTFLVFSDYARNAVRLSALMKQQVIFVYSHDSIGLGEDGPTHQPIEHINMLRMTPDLDVWRPCDEVETAVAWKYAIEKTDQASCLLLSRQTVPHQTRSIKMIENIARGGYVLRDCEDTPDIIFIATGSEVSLAMEAAEQLSNEEKQVRVVSMPCTEIFEKQSQAYRDSVLPSNVDRRIAIEAGNSDFWYKYVGLKGRVIGIDHFGASAPAKVLFQAFNFTVEDIVHTANELTEGVIA